MNSARRVKDLIRNLSKKTGVDSTILLRQYMMDHLLERITLSRYRETFILKGGMLISSWVGVPLRSTKDMDATILGGAIEADDIRRMFMEVISIDTNDGIRFLLNRIESIREESVFPCHRISMTAKLDESRIPMHIDVTAGDRITPKEVEYAYPMMLENRSIPIIAYNLETVLAEKLETILSRGVTNSRMRDFYDIHQLTLLGSHIIKMGHLRSAFQETSRNRGNPVLLEQADAILESIHGSGDLIILWQNYRKRNPYAEGIEFLETVEGISRLVRSMRDA